MTKIAQTYLAEGVWPRTILATAAASRFATIGNFGLWVDELWTWKVIGHGLGDFFANMRQDADSPLYYLLLTGWIKIFGTSEIALRLLSTVASLAAITQIIFFFPRIIGTRAALIEAGMLALLPFDVMHAHEARRILRLNA